MIAADLVRRGYRIAVPYGEDWNFDLILCRDERMLERVQCKHSESNGVYITVRCCSASLTNGWVKAIKRYTAAMIDWLAVYDRTTDRCYYVPAEQLSDGRRELRLRLQPTLNHQRQLVHYARTTSRSDDGASRIRTGGLFGASEALYQAELWPRWVKW
jgi:PD-(D/E)XK endonuclease